MERREKRALAFLLAASLLCLALVGLAAGDPPAERAEALFQAGREEFDRAAEELLADWTGGAVLLLETGGRGSGVSQRLEAAPVRDGGHPLPGGGGAGPDRGVPLRRLGGGPLHQLLGDQPCALRRPDRLPGGGAVGLGALGRRLALGRGGGRQPLLCAQAGARVVLL